jgi:hypothetical protein
VTYRLSTPGGREAVVVVLDVPGHVCDACGESYFDEAASEHLDTLTEQARRADLTSAGGAEVAVLRFPAADASGAAPAQAAA